MLFDHGSSIRGQGRSLWVMVDGSATEHQISDGVGVSIGTTPADRFTLSRDHPDDALLAPCLSDAVSVVHVDRPVATVLIKVCPGRGLNGEGHVLCFVESIIGTGWAGSGGCLCHFLICHVSADLAPHARQNVGLVRLQAVVVHPLTIGPIPSNHETKDGTTGHACVAILGQGGSKPTDLGSACEGVHLESPHALGNAAFGQVDVEHAWFGCLCVL